MVSTIPEDSGRSVQFSVAEMFIFCVPLPISPEEVREWTDWDINSERVHGISREQLIREGHSPFDICRRMKEQLSGQTIYSDYPPCERMWLEKLWEVCGEKNPGIVIGNVDDLLIGIMSPGVRGRSKALTRQVYIKFEARAKVKGQHRAALDVQYLIEMWKLACAYRDDVVVDGTV